MTGEDVYTFAEVSEHFLLKIRLRNERMIDRESESFSVSCLQLLRFWIVKYFCAFRFLVYLVLKLEKFASSKFYYL